MQCTCHIDKTFVQAKQSTGISSLFLVSLLMDISVEYNHIIHKSLFASIDGIPYKNKYWRGTKFGEMMNRYANAKFKSHQNFFYMYHL